MSILCKLKLHKWRYNVKSILPPFNNLEEITRYCERCEKIEKSIWAKYPGVLNPPQFKDIKET